MKLVLLLICFLSLTPLAQARSLTDNEMARVQSIHQMVKEVDRKPLAKFVAELEKAPYTQTNILMKEAMAKAYVEIIKEQQVKTQSQKEWLYSMVSLNMAYLQFVGTKQRMKTNSGLNLLICQKLRQFLPDDIDSRPGFRQSIENDHQDDLASRRHSRLN